MRKKSVKKPHLGKLLKASQDKYRGIYGLTGGTGFAYRTNKGAEYFANSDGCFAYLTSNNDVGNMSEFVFSINNGGAKLKLPHNKAFILWILNDSPFSKYFTTKRWYDAITYGVKWNNKTCFNSFLTGCVALRLTWEYTHGVAAWHRLCELGVNKNLAFVCSHWLNYKDRFTDAKLFGGGHAVFGSSRIDGIQKYLKEGVLDIVRTRGYQFFNAVRTISEWDNRVEVGRITYIARPKIHKVWFGNDEFYDEAVLVAALKKFEMDTFGEVK